MKHRVKQGANSIKQAVQSSLALFLLTSVQLALTQPAAAQQGSIAPEVRDILQSMVEYIGGKQSIEVMSESSIDVRLEAGLLAEQATTGHMVVKRPDKALVTMDGDLGPRELYISNGQLTIFSPDKGYYARAPVSKNVDEAIYYATDVLGIETPLFDLLYGETADDLIDLAHTALYLGTSVIRGVECEHLVLRGAEADVQMWIATGDQPELKKLAITSPFEAGAPRFIAFMDWTVSPRVADKSFSFDPPKGSVEIPFIGRTLEND